MSYSSLIEKHKKILQILNKCIDLEHTGIDKKSNLYLSSVPLMEKPTDKLKISTTKKQEN